VRPTNIVLAALICLAHAVVAVAQRPVSFQTRRDYFTPNGTVLMALGDLNGDGNVDIAVSSGNAIDLLFGNGDGTFAHAVTITGLTDPVGIEAVDVNGDGKLDLVVAEQSANDIAVLLGNGDGTFQAPIRTGGSYHAFSISVADFNGDGIPDVAASQYPDSRVTILLGQGNGQFVVSNTYYAGEYPASIVAGDFNNDGKIDLVAADQTPYRGSGLSLLLGNGDGTLQKALAVNAGHAEYYVVAADVNNDGNLDLIATNGGTSVSAQLVLGNGDGTFQPATNIFPGTSTVGPVMAVDLNGDGIIDVAAETANGRITIAFGNGNGTFNIGGTFDCGTFIGAILTADFNHDGHADLASLGGTTAAVSILLGDGAGNFTEPPAYPTGNGPDLVQLADVNGDGILDAVVGNSGKSISILLGNGTGGFAAPLPVPEPAAPLAFVVADFNNDGKPDLIVVSAGPTYDTNNFTIQLGNCDGTFRHGYTRVYTSRAATIFIYMAVGDFNGDGIPDLALVSGHGLSQGYVNILINNGDGSFQPTKYFAVGASVGSLAVGDFNGDGKLDVAVTTLTGVGVMLGDGTGNLGAPIVTALSLAPIGLATADFNQDGKLDLVASVGGLSSSVNGEQILLGNGDGTFSMDTFATTGDIVYSLLVADLNGDGLPDIVCQNRYYGNIGVLIGSQGGRFQAAEYFGGGFGENAFAVGDVNGDGKPDIVTANYYGNDMSVLLNTTP